MARIEGRNSNGETLIGTDEDDTISARSGPDTIFGRGGNDLIFGSGGSDLIFGESGNDEIVGGPGNDALFGGAGNDIIFGEGDAFGGDGNDTLFGGAGNDVLVGGAGNDRLAVEVGLADFGSDVFSGGDGFDTIAFETGTVIEVNGSFSQAVALPASRGVVVNLISAFRPGSVSDFGQTQLDADGEVIVDISAPLRGQILDFNRDTVFPTVEKFELTGFADYFLDSSASHIIEGGSGDDFISGGGGADIIDGGAGIDTALYRFSPVGVSISLLDFGSGGSGSLGEAAGDKLFSIENVHGSDHDDSLIGSIDDNVLRGFAGNDSLIGFGGDDTLIGGDGDDDLFGGLDGDLLSGGRGNDTLDGGSGNDSLDGGGGSDTAVFTSWNSVSGFGFKTGSIILADGRIPGSAVLLSTIFGVPPSTFEIERDSLSGIENVVGSDFNETITGNLSGNRLEGRGGNDVINGGLSLDTLLGGDGDDRLIGGPGSHAELAPGVLIPDNDVLDGGAGIDTADYSGNVGTVLVTLGLDGANGSTTEFGPQFGPSFDVLRSIENVIGSGFNDLITGNTDDNVLSGGTGNDAMRGGDGADRIFGEQGKDSLFGEQGDDELFGGNDDDTLDGGLGNDALDGGRGSDTAVFTSWNVISVPGFVSALITLAGTGTGGGGTAILSQGNVEIERDSLSSIENVVGSDFNETITGNLSGNRLEGRGGNDVINGGLSLDTLLGGDGNDRLIGGPGSHAELAPGVLISDNDVLDGGAGIDTADYSGNVGTVLVTLGLDGANGATTEFGPVFAPSFDVLRSIENVIGSGFNDLITGNTDANAIEGRAGDDTLRGGAGDDTINGGAGSDDVSGGGGADILRGGDGNDTLNGGAGADDVSGGGGADILRGGAGDDTINGGTGADELSGGRGADILRGGAGDDSYHVALGDNVDEVFDAGGAADKLVIGSFADIIASERVGNDLIVTFVDGSVTVVNHFLATNRIENVEDAGGNLVVLAAGTIGGDADGIVSGTAGADALDGRGGDDFVFGNGGDDLLLGGLGNDYLHGGAGDDALSGGHGDDRLKGGAGNDLLLGRGGDDRLFGGGGDDKLMGGAGRDLLLGGLGADRLDGGADLDADIFRFTLLAHIGLGPERDVVIGFIPGTDKIDVAEIDAEAGAAGLQAFAFIGTEAFSGEGQIRAVQVGLDTLLQFNTAGSDGPEADLLLIDAIAAHLGEADFLL